MHKIIILAALACLSASGAIPTADTVTNSIGMKFKRIPAGTFQIGYEGGVLPASYAGDLARTGKGFYNEYPRHAVTLTRDFYMGMHEVTNQQFFQFRSNHASDFIWYENGATYPVYRLTWSGADSFCQWLTANDPNGWTYRLPTEAEWEYCCRAGTTTRFYTGDTISTTQANVLDGWGGSLQGKNVGTYPPNPWGLYDMHGNADEWCLDWFAPYSAGPDTNPGGLISASPRDAVKAMRGNGRYYFWARSASRGSTAPANTNDGFISFRVVISEITKDSLRYKPMPDTLAPWLTDVSQNLPSPLTLVTGETYTDAEGLAFKRVRMARDFYPSQKDSIVYVSLLPVSNDSGALARRLSRTYGVLYRLSNRYELYNAGLSQDAGYHLTIIPDLFYATGRPHPDSAVYLWRSTVKVPVDDSIGGQLWYDVNHCPALAECPNGDIIATWFSGIGEDGPDQVTAGSRLRFGDTAWDAQTSLALDWPGIPDDMMTFWNNGKGRMLRMKGSRKTTWTTLMGWSDDNGLTWSPWARSFGNVKALRPSYYVPLAGDTVVCITEGYGFMMMMSADGGLHWAQRTQNPVDLRGHHVLMALDDGNLLGMSTRASVKNSDSTATMHSAISTDKGLTWTFGPTPFKTAGAGFYGAALKLQSGRLVAVTHGATVKIVAESEDQGRTWFCRRKFGSTWGVDYMGGYMHMMQSRDGMVHLIGSHGSGTGNGDNEVITFSEQWLREGTCLDIAEWGINTAGMVAAGCPDEDALPPLTVSTAGANPRRPVVPAMACSPNPFNPVVRISVSRGLINPDVKIFDCAGTLVADLSASFSRGHGVEWNAAGRPSGLYLVTLSAKGKRLVKPIVLAK